MSPANAFTFDPTFSEWRRRRRATAVAMAALGASHHEIGAALGISRVAATRLLGRAGVPRRRSAFSCRVFCASQLGTRLFPLDLDTL
jgi:transposase-like protein